MVTQRGRSHRRGAGAADGQAARGSKRGRSAPSLIVVLHYRRNANLPPAAPVESSSEPNNALMAPVKEPSNVDDQLKDVIQHLFDVQSAVHGYLPETQGPLVEKIIDLTESLAKLSAITSPLPANTNLSSTGPGTNTTTLNNNNGIHSVQLPPEILDYVDGGRNPDVYKREFVEVVQRGNAVLNGKQVAFRSFSQVFAQELSSAMPEVKNQADRVLALLTGDGTDANDSGRERG